MQLTSRKQSLLKILTLGGMALFLASCSSESNRKATDPLFSLSLGKLPTQMYLFSEDKFIPNTRNYIRTTRGSLYISDKASQKIMGFTSYGDLVYLLQNSNTNPNTGASNFVSVSYPFNNIGLIEVSPQGLLYVQEEVAKQTQIFDPVEGMILENCILRFDSKGQFKDFLGQQGIGTEPFGIILQMNTTDKGDLFVLSQFPTKKVVYWFNSEGSLLWRVNLDDSSLPMPTNSEGENLLPSLQNIFPSRSENKIYLNIIYYDTLLDENTGGELGIQVKNQKIFGFNLKTKTYDEEIPLPLYRDKENDMNYLLEMMGVVGNNLIFELSNNNLLNLTFILVNRNNYRVTEQKIQFPMGENLDLNLSPEGLLTGMFLERNKVGIYWWQIGDMGFGI